MVRRVLVAVAVAAIGVVGTATPALAHWVYNEGYVWTEGNGGHCVKLRSSLTADQASADKTQVDNGAKENVSYPPYSCTAGLQWWVDPPINPGYDADYTELDWSLDGGSGVFCMHLPYRYNTTVMGAGGLNQDHLWSDTNIRHCFTDHGYPPQGMVAAWGWTGVYYNGAWRGGWVFTDWHDFNR
jgi:hypothetical protein